MKPIPVYVLAPAAWLLWAALLVPAWASGSRTVGELTAYLGVLPAAMIQDHAAEHPEATMHGGLPSGRHAYHVTVALFDASTGRRIEDARVEAQVTPAGLSPVRRALEPMRIADTLTWGNYFTMRGGGPYHIEIRVLLPDEGEPVTIDFTHEHATR
jgi:hypothetical protein